MPLNDTGKIRIAFRTLGCRLNQFETDSLASQFERNGYLVVDHHQPADVVVINTCTVTDQSDQKSRQMIRQAARNHPGAMLVVTGCMVNNHREQLESNPDQITWLVDNQHKSSIFSLVDAHLKGEIIHPVHPRSGLFDYEPVENIRRTRSWIKIQDGCDNYCTFCIIPKVRGRAVSRPSNEILENIRKVVDHGFREIVLTGVNIGRYHWEGIDFETLVEKILDLPGNFRLRIGSIEPDGYGDRLIGLFAHPKLTPHLHLCLQSGSDKILLKMRRMYTVSEYLGLVDKIRNLYPAFNFTTDIIVGFPGETEEDFAMTTDIIRRVGFGHVHTFKFSVRKGTRAERMPEQIAEKTKTLRSEIVRTIAAGEKRRYRSSLIGTEQTVLVERIIKGHARGYGENYVPISFPADQVARNTFVRVRLISLDDGDDPVLHAEPVLLTPVSYE